MRKIVNTLYQKNTIIYKVMLFLVTVISIVYLFPKGGHFEYDFTNGQPWKYKNLIAKFDFSIQKTTKEILQEREEVQKNATPYFLYNSTIVADVIEEYQSRVIAINKVDFSNYGELQRFRNVGLLTIHKIYKNGFLSVENNQNPWNKNTVISLKKNNEVQGIPFKNLVDSKEVLSIISRNLSGISNVLYRGQMISLLSEIIKPNVSYDVKYTEKVLENELQNISLTQGKVSKGDLIITKGAIVEGEILAILNSLKSESESKIWTDTNYYWVLSGYTILVSLALLMLFLFLRKNRQEIFTNNTKVTFIFFNVFLMIFIQTLVIKYNTTFLYVVPLSVLPIVLKAFFDARLGLFTHVLTVLLLGYIAPNSFEFIYLHIIAGIVTILTVSELYKRANLFISVAQITVVYMITYLAFSIIKEGNLSQINIDYFVMFIINGLLSFLSLILIYMYEKIFGLVSDVTLLELSNTNSKLLRELNDKAPGTFQHSIQVASLAEVAANEIGANSMLVRTGALYHDIGKMQNPLYFTENQNTGVNPHNDLSPMDSAEIILDHVIHGIEIAKKNKLPDRIIDFIRTHHGTSLVYYFYMKEKEQNFDIEVAIEKFKYRGPIPFSKETAILMMCDASEASSKSLKTPTAQSISDLIDKIIAKQIADNQFVNSDITFREIEVIKKVIKKRLMNIYHLRVEYPE